MNYSLNNNNELLNYIEKLVNRYLIFPSQDLYDEVFDSICSDVEDLINSHIKVGLNVEKAISKTKQSVKDIIKEHLKVEDVKPVEEFFPGGQDKLYERKLTDFVKDPNIKETGNIIGVLFGSLFLMVAVGATLSFLVAFIF